MREAGRRSAISTSQLGLYSDHSDRYNRNRYSSVTRKFAIGVMVVVVVILVAIFLYDFTSATSVNSKLNQETKHIYILQNALKKPLNITKKFSISTVSPEVNSTNSIRIENRSDNENPGNPFFYDETDEYKVPDAEIRSQNLNNFKLRKRVLKSIENKEEEAEGKQLFDNHALVYRVRQRYKHPDSNEDMESSEESRPVPFHWELKTPQPTSFKRQRYPQLSQYRYPHASRNIQEIIKYLTNDADVPNRGIKFTGVYVNPKKYDLIPELGGMMSNSDRSEEDDGSYSVNEDPFYQYKPKHPADVNLLATSNFRFSPTGLHRYNYDAYGRPVNYNKAPSPDAQYENSGSYSNSYSKRRKPKPFSVMLDIYPITDIVEQNKKITRPRQVPVEDYELRRPIQYNRGPKFYAPPPQSVTGMSTQAMTDEEERQQMIFHLNLYPRKKNKMSRHDIIQRSESMDPEEQQQFVNKVWSPLETIAKHLAVERSKFVDNEMEDNLASIRYQETTLDNENETRKFDQMNDSSSQNDSIPSNHKSIIEEDFGSTEKYEYEAQKIVGTTTESKCDDCNTTISLDETTTNETKSAEVSKDVDTIEGFKRFSDSISKTN
ncbi:uncharacterized protein LOC114875528 [Osmia bicornis bicornis]|uniref:uncharacterized protein LOC114875528 n=1 Tax=Osmia bicornis bicornis TaxID=1437191 RepID=UPI0010F61E13|nr:uncharacterized protein LOC114875528 [Osmia bicornis bicornis]